MREVELQRLIDNTSAAVCNEVDEANSKILLLQRPGLVKFAFRLLATSSWSLTKTDKDGGFAAATTTSLTIALDGTLDDKEKYKIVSQNHVCVGSRRGVFEGL